MRDMSEQHGPNWPETRLVHSNPRSKGAAKPMMDAAATYDRLAQPAFAHLTKPHWSHVKGSAWGKDKEE